MMNTQHCKSVFRSRCVSIAALLLICMLGLLLSTSAAVVESAEFSSVSVSVLNPDSKLMIEATLSFTKEWTSIGSGDPLSLKHTMPLSLGIPQESEVVCDEDSAALSNYIFMLRFPGSTTACLFPMNPSGNFQFFRADLSNGGSAFLQLPGDAFVGSIRLTSVIQETTMALVTPLEIATAMMGEVITEQDPNTILEMKISRRNCQNLIAHSEKRDQVSALLESSRLIEDALKLYYSRRSRYPNQLCQLYTGPDAVVGELPSNPYKPSESLCISQIAGSKPEGYVRYFVLTGDSAPAEQIGQYYWLAALGPGEETKPNRPLPVKMNIPPRSIAWFEPAPETSKASQ
ncbi:MAG: hypothetical protein M3R04_00285 [bacterium]|nr:hypothetical protein [bacterium]